MLCKKCKNEIPDDAILCCYCGVRQAQRERKPKSRGNGTGTVFKLPNGKYKAVVVLYYYLDDKGKKQSKRRTKTFVKKSDAINSLPLLKGQESKSNVTLQQLREIYEKSAKYDKLSNSQKDKLTYAWNRCETIKGKKIVELTVDDMQNVIDSQVKTYYPARDIKVVLSHLYELAIKREYVPYNKTEYLDLPGAVENKKDAFNADEIASFWADWDSGVKYTGYILIMIYTGMRYGELAKIKKEDIHLDDKYMIGGIKSDAGIDREIAISDKIVPIVEYWADKNKRKLLEMNEDNFYSQYWDTLERLKVRHMPPHCCRHTYFTRLAEAGVQPAIITAAGGHKDYSVTLGYTHIPLADKVDAVNKI